MQEAIEQEQYVVRGERLRQEASAAWAQYLVDGLHVTASKADAWFARLEAGRNATECHV
jgi:hypothetical protein